MANSSTEVSDTTLIRELLTTWANATRLGKQDEVLVSHAVDVTIFDVLPPLKYAGAEAYRKSWDEWQPTVKEPGLFEIHDLNITAGQDVAFAYCLIHCGGTQPNGRTFEDWVRATFCLCKLEGKWLITHQHISMPMAKQAETPNSTL
jgi:ketosteroid isomerase-like protein